MCMPTIRFFPSDLKPSTKHMHLDKFYNIYQQYQKKDKSDVLIASIQWNIYPKEVIFLILSCSVLIVQLNRILHLICCLGGWDLETENYEKWFTTAGNWNLKKNSKMQYSNFLWNTLVLPHRGVFSNVFFLKIITYLYYL